MGACRAAARPRRSAWPWIVAFVIVVALAVAAWFAGEAIAEDRRDQDHPRPGHHQPRAARRSGRARWTSRRDAPAADRRQPRRGRSPRRTCRSSPSGDVTVTAHERSRSAGASWKRGRDGHPPTTKQLRDLMSTVDGFPADSSGLDRPGRRDVDRALAVRRQASRSAVALTPAPRGDLVLTPASLQLAGAEITADGLRQRSAGSPTSCCGTGPSASPSTSPPG